MKNNYKFVIAYDGTRYHGWQYLPTQDTIQGKLQSVLSRMTGEEVEVNGAGRTDAGVHAKGMVANAVLQTDKSSDEIKEYMNRYLPDDIAVQDVKVASERFHARYRAVGKTYCYTCYTGESKPVFQRKYVTTLPQRPNLEQMKTAAEYLIGEKDFKSFCGNSKMKKSTIRTVDEIQIYEKQGFLYFQYHGDGFLQNMVRIMTGTLLEVGYGHLRPQDMQEILEACDRKKAGPMAPPEGLCLMKVDY